MTTFLTKSDRKHLLGELELCISEMDYSPSEISKSWVTFMRCPTPSFMPRWLLGCLNVWTTFVTITKGYRPSKVDPRPHPVYYWTMSKGRHQFPTFLGSTSWFDSLTREPLTRKIGSTSLVWVSTLLTILFTRVTTMDNISALEFHPGSTFSWKPRTLTRKMQPGWVHPWWTWDPRVSRSCLELEVWFTQYCPIVNIIMTLHQAQELLKEASLEYIRHGESLWGWTLHQARSWSSRPSNPVTS